MGLSWRAALFLGMVACGGSTSTGGTDGGTGGVLTGINGSSSSSSSSSSSGSTPEEDASVGEYDGSVAPPENQPRPECVAFAEHYCDCLGSNATATCKQDMANGCEDGVELCASQLSWYTCVTSNACGTDACTQPSGC